LFFFTDLKGLAAVFQILFAGLLCLAQEHECVGPIHLEPN
jgi:hypothetical protein